jgi:hypothetical protein
MTPDEPYVADFPVAVPPRLRHLLNQNLPKATRVVVNDGDGKKVNGIRLTNTHGGLPDESLDSIAEAVTAIMHIAWRDQETEDPDIGMPPMDFTVVCEHTVKRGGKRTRLSFSYVYKGDLIDDDDDVLEETITMEERSIQRAFDTLERQNASLIGHVDLIHGTLRDFFKQQMDATTAQGAASAETMKQAIPMFFAGMQQSLNAKYMEYSIGKAEAEAKASSERFVNSVKAVAPFIGMALQQFMQHKLGIDPSVIFGGGAAAAAPEEPAVADDEEVPKHLVAFFAGALGNSLTNIQRRTLAQKFKPAELAALDDLFCAQTDGDALEAYAVVVKKVGAKLVELQHLLTGEQGEILGQFMQTLNAYAERTHAPA